MGSCGKNKQTYSSAFETVLSTTINLNGSRGWFDSTLRFNGNFAITQHGGIMNIKDWKKKMNNANLNQCDEVLDKISKANAESDSEFISVEANLRYSDLQGWVKDRKNYIHFMSDLLGWKGGIK